MGLLVWSIVIIFIAFSVFGMDFVAYVIMMAGLFATVEIFKHKKLYIRILIELIYSIVALLIMIAYLEIKYAD